MNFPRLLHTYQSQSEPRVLDADKIHGLAKGHKLGNSLAGAQNEKVVQLPLGHHVQLHTSVALCSLHRLDDVPCRHIQQQVHEVRGHD